MFSLAWVYYYLSFDLFKFFSPLSLVNITIQYNADGRASGDADVDFATHEDAVEAMKRNKALIRQLMFVYI